LKFIIEYESNHLSFLDLLHGKKNDVILIASMYLK